MTAPPRELARWTGEEGRIMRLVRAESDQYAVQRCIRPERQALAAAWQTETSTGLGRFSLPSAEAARMLDAVTGRTS